MSHDLDPRLEWREAEVAGLPLRYRHGGPEHAAGPPCVLVHGLVVSGSYLVPTARRLAAGRRVLVPDLPGFGRSPGHGFALDPRGLAAALGALLAETAAEPALLVASSFGCQVVTELAILAPEAVAGALLVGPVVDPGARSLPSQAARFVLDTTREPLPLAAIILRDLWSAGALRAVLTARAMFAYRIETRLPALAAPTLVVRGARDPIAPQRWCEEAAALLPAGRLAVVPGAPHAVNYAAPEALAALTLALAAELAAGGAAAGS